MTDVKENFTRICVIRKMEVVFGYSESFARARRKILNVSINNAAPIAGDRERFSLQIEAQRVHANYKAHAVVIDIHGFYIATMTIFCILFLY